MAGVATTSESHTAKIPKGKEIKQICPQGFKIKDYLAYAPNVYRRDKVSNKAHYRLARMHKCQRSYKARVAVGKIHDHLKGHRRERRLLSSVTPFGAWAIPEAIVMCESRGNFRAVNGSNPNRPAGAYQIITSTWLGYGGGAFAPTADAATPYQQHVIAGRIWAGGSGRGQWAC